MRRISVSLITALSTTALTQVVSAADMPVKAPVIAPLYNWTGPYAGVVGGYGWGNSKQTDSGLPKPRCIDFEGQCIGGGTRRWLLFNARRVHRRSARLQLATSSLDLWGRRRLFVGWYQGKFEYLRSELSHSPCLRYSSSICSARCAHGSAIRWALMAIGSLM